MIIIKSETFVCPAKAIGMRHNTKHSIEFDLYWNNHANGYFICTNDKITDQNAGKIMAEISKTFFDYIKKDVGSEFQIFEINIENYL